MACVLYYQLIESPEKYIFGILFLLLAVLAAVGNTIGILVLRQPELKSITNRIVTSLCVIGCFSSYGFLPILAWNMFDNKSSELCWLEIPREIIVAVINITLIFHITLLAHDRYVLLKRGAEYNQHINYKKTTILICLSWLLPSLLVLIVHIFPQFNMIITSCAYFLPFPVGVAIYLVLRCTIIRKEKEMETHATEISNCGLQTRKTILDNVYQHRHVASAKNLNLIMAVSVCCFLPLAIGNIAYVLISFGVLQNSRVLEIYYLLGSFIANVLACVHLAIYYKRYPEFNKSFWKFVSLKKIYVENCV